MLEYDVIIVGSGLGGLVCGHILSKEGYSVCIIEKHHQIGGCLQTFRRDNCIFDTGMHYVGSLQPGEILYKFFKYFGILDKIKIKKLDEDAFDVIGFKDSDTEYKFGMGYDNFINQLVKVFPEEEAAIEKYCEEIQKIVDSLKLYNLQEIDNANFFESRYITGSATEFIASITSNKKLQNVLAGTNSLYAGESGKSPLLIHALITNFFIRSAYRFVDGGDQIAHLLAETIIQNNGNIIKGKAVEKFVFENDQLVSVKLDDKKIIRGKYFISDIHPVKTLEMVDSPKIKKAYRKRINAAPNTISTFTLYVSLKEHSFKYLNYNYYHNETDDVWSIADYNEDNWPKGYMFLTPASSKSDEYADCLIIMTYMKYDDVKKWENSYIEQRGADYLEFKKRKAEKLLDVVEEKFPDLRSKIKSYYTSTPLTYRDYTGTVDGALYGVAKDCNNPLESYIPPKTKIPNLLLTGQNVNLHGVLGVIIGSVLTCSEILGINYLIKKIKDADEK